MSSPKLTESIIHAGASDQSYQRGYALWQDGAISNTVIQGNLLLGECEGTSAPYYDVRIELDEGGIRAVYCSCPYEFDGYCRHIVALLWLTSISQSNLPNARLRLSRWLSLIGRHCLPS